MPEVPTGETPNPTPAATATPTPTGETPESKPNQQTPEQLAAELESAKARISELNKENASRRKAQEELEKKQTEAEEAKKREQGEFKELADEYKGKFETADTALTAANERIAQYEKLIGADLDQRIADWPDEVKALIPSGDGVDALQRLEAITKATPAAAKLMGKAEKPKAPNIDATARSASTTPDAEAAREAQARLARRALG